MFEEYRTIYITCKNEEEAIAIGKSLVQNRLAACANIIPSIKSIYQWEGSLVEDAETVLLLKSKESLVDQIIEHTKKIHSYQVPCILSYKIEKGNKEYLDWILESTKG